MTISNVTAAPPVAPMQSAQSAKPQTPAAAAAQIQDTVHLSAAALAASSGDVDHDGDSH